MDSCKEFPYDTSVSDILDDLGGSLRIINEFGLKINTKSMNGYLAFVHLSEHCKEIFLAHFKPLLFPLPLGFSYS